MMNKLKSCIAIGIGVFLFGFIFTVIIGDWLGTKNGELLTPYLMYIFISIVFLASVIAVCTFLIINNTK